MPFTPNFGIPYQMLTAGFELNPEGLVGEDGALAVDSALSGLDLRIDTLENTLHYKRLDESILSGTAASIAFNSIPQTHRHLRIIGVARGDTAATFVAWGLRINGDSTAVYDTTVIVGSGTTVLGSEASNSTRANLGEITAASATAGAASTHDIIIPYYTGSTFWKQFYASETMSVGTGAGGMFVKTVGSRRRSTAAITSITLLPDSGNFVAGTSFALYGLP